MKRETMMMLSCFATFCFFAGGLSFAQFNIPPKTVGSLNATAYMGRWYQMYASLIPTATFEKDGYCVTADYFNPKSFGGKLTFELTNSMLTGNSSGTLSQAYGTAENDDVESNPGKYKITFDQVSMPAVAGSYWIIDVGELTSGATQYPWAIVSVPFQAMVWVLARDIDDFKEKFDEPVVQELEQLGFTYFFNKPIKTYQSSTHCKYVDPPST